MKKKKKKKKKERENDRQTHTHTETHKETMKQLSLNNPDGTRMLKGKVLSVRNLKCIQVVGVEQDEEQCETLKPHFQKCLSQNLLLHYEIFFFILQLSFLVFAAVLGFFLVLFLFVRFDCFKDFVIGLFFFFA